MHYNYFDLDFLNKELSVIWPGWTAVKLLGKGSFGAVYEIHRTIRRNSFGISDAESTAQDIQSGITDAEAGKQGEETVRLNAESLPEYFEFPASAIETTEKAALKVLRVPESDLEIEQIELLGMSHEDTGGFYEKQVAAIRNEIRIMQKFVGNSHLVSYEDYVIRKRPESIGWDIYIRMELLTALPDYVEQHPLDEQTTLKMALDISEGLRDCHERGIIHRDIKPQNVFVTEEGRFKLGDFGVSRAMPGTQSVLSFKGTLAYMAPEVYRMASTDARSDIYSLGVVLYQCLNDNRLPFVPETITPESIETAKLRRLNGEKVPAPAHGSPDLQSIVGVSLSFRPEDRFQTAKAMHTALLAVSGSDGSSSESPALPQNSKESGAAAAASQEAACSPEPASSPQPAALPEVEAGSFPEAGRSKLPAVVIAAVFIVAVMITGVIGGTSLIRKMNSRLSSSASAGTTAADAPGTAAADAAATGPAADAAAGGAVMGETDDSARTGSPDEGTDIAGNPAAAGDAGAGNALNAGKDNGPIEDYPIEWNDEILEGKMREVTGIYDKDIYYSDVKDITKLDIRDDNGTTLVFGPIKDISALACMTKLEKLYVEFGEVTDISCLAGMKNMKDLSLGYNQITDISPLAGMTQLEDLILTGNENIRDLSPLSGLKNLKGLWLGECGISDISALAGLTRLEKLYLFENKISDISPVENMTRMKELVIFKNNISDISSLHRMGDLDLLNAWGNKISDMGVVTHFMWLNYLDLGKNEISDISPLRSITDLPNLLLYDNKITDISVLREMEGLEYLNIQNNPIEDYSPLDNISVDRIYK